MGKLDGYHDIDQDEDEDMEYYADVHGYEDDEPEPVELTDAEVIARLKDALTAANARIAELEQAIEDSAYSPIEIMPLEDAFDTLTEYFHDVLLWNEPEFVEGRAAVDTVRFAINEYDKRIAELEAWKAAVPVESIAFCVDAADYTYDVMWAEAKAWIDAQPQPTPSPE